MLLHKLSVAILFLLGVGLCGLLIIRFVITRSITCSPECVGMNLTDRDLQGIDLHKVRLMEAQLQSANLSDANLREADLSGANLMRANLRNADLTDARLIGTDLSGARLEGAILKGADLSGANLSEADLTNVDLHTTLLGGANFVKAKLTNAQLQGTNLAGLNFSEAGMAGANLERTILAGAALSRADLSGATLVLADLTGAWLNLANLVGANLTNADLAGSSLIGAELASTNLQGSNLAGAVLVGAQLHGANLRSANLRDARTLLTQLPQRTMQLDPLLQELNELQRQSILQDARLDGIAFDSRTIWPDGAVIADVNARSPLPLALQSTDDITSTLTTSATQSSSATDGLPIAKRVAVSFFINSIRDINPQQGRFKGDLYVDLYWHEPGLAADQEIGALDPETLWNPRLLLVNSPNGNFLFDFYGNSNEPDNNIRLSTRAIGDFSTDFNLRDFPFDQQALTIQFEPGNGDSDKILLEFIDLNQRQVPSEKPYVQAVPKGRYVDSQAVNNEWTVSDTRIAQQLYVYQTDQSSYSRFQIEVTLVRQAAPYVWKYMFPLVLVALFAWSTLLVDAANLVVRLRLLALLLLIIASIHIVLWATLPATAYLTYLDRFLLLHYAVLVALIALVFTIYYVQKRGVRGAQWVNRGLLVSYPLCYVGINLLLYWQLGR